MMDIQALLKQAKKMQSEMSAKENELKEKKYEASVGGGAIHVCVNGNTQIESIEIEKDLLKVENQEELQDMIIVAVNDALSQMSSDKDESMSELTGGVKMPGMF